jgi:HPt (histidine-containing phosphotransfer) domain-containing protein
MSAMRAQPAQEPAQPRLAFRPPAPPASEVPPLRSPKPAATPRHAPLKSKPAAAKAKHGPRRAAVAAVERESSVPRLARWYLDEAPAMLGRMHAAAQARDAKGLREAAQALGAASLTFGAVDLADACKEAEMVARAAPEKALDRVARCQAMWARIREGLEAQLRDHP